MGIELRKERRIKVNLPIGLIYQNKVLLVAQTENISRLGTYIETDKKISTGIDIDIKLEIPSSIDKPALSGEIQCKGSIFRCNLIKETATAKYYGVGVFFTGFLKDSDKEKLSKYIDYLGSREDVAVKEGLKRWKNKRGMAKTSKQEHLRESEEVDSQKDMVDLLQQILKCLAEIKQLLQTKK